MHCAVAESAVVFFFCWVVWRNTFRPTLFLDFSIHAAHGGKRDDLEDLVTGVRRRRCVACGLHHHVISALDAVNQGILLGFMNSAPGSPGSSSCEPPASLFLASLRLDARRRHGRGARYGLRVLVSFLFPVGRERCR